MKKSIIFILVLAAPLLWIQLISSSHALTAQVTTRHGASNLMISPNDFLREIARCASDEVATGGGYLTSGETTVIVGQSEDIDASFGRGENEADGWVVAATNNGKEPQRLDITVNCLKLIP